ncbi:MAG: hypothetical protein C0605_07990 [Hyphomicrobiales bacterium]|nr:MAG: hypothetical protein C0605_07990 [Hyphomicrobiales bacterium]
MTGVLFNTQKAVYALLDAAAVASGGVHDDVSDGYDTFPYVEIGETLAEPDDGSLTDGTAEFLTLHVWSRAQGFAETKQIMEAIHTVLHGKKLTVAGRASALCWVDQVSTLRDPDGKTRHGVVRLRIVSRT